MSVPQIPTSVPAARVVQLDLYDAEEQSANYHGFWKRLQDETPFNLVWTPKNGGHWIATRADTIQEVVSDYSRFCSYRMLIFPGDDQTARWDVLPISLDPPQHAHFRNLLTAGLSPKVIKERSDEIRGFAVQLIEALKPRGQCEFVREYGEELPIRMVFIIMGLPYEDKAKAMVIINALTKPDGTMTVKDVVREFGNYLRPFIADRMGKVGTDLISQICNGLIENRPITENEAVQLCVQTFAAGLESVRNALAFTMLQLARDADLRRQLVENPSQIPAAVNEALRRYAAMVVARQVVADIEYEGVQLRKGDLIACPLQLTGLDEQKNACPMEFRLDRKGVVSNAFGAGPHFCPGKWLAELEMRVTLEEWLLRIPDFALDDAEIAYSGGILGSIDALPLIWNVQDTLAEHSS